MLDCSGFVTWSFINADFSASAIGHGTSSQVSKGTRISLSYAQPGDLAFYNDISHVGIVGGKDDSGNILVIHCSSGANNVITAGGFDFDLRHQPRNEDYFQEVLLLALLMQMLVKLILRECLLLK